jgi:hypothetical protein
MTFRTLALGALMLCKVLAVPSGEEWGSNSAADRKDLYPLLCHDLELLLTIFL